MKPSDKTGLLTHVLTKVLAAGASAFEVEYKDRYERVFALNGPLGVGVAEFRSGTAEAAALRRELYALRGKGKKITVSGVEYLLRVEVFDSFGEDAFRVTVVRT